MPSLEIRKCTIAEMEVAPNIGQLLDEYAAEASIGGLPHPSVKAKTYKHLETIGAIHPVGAFLDGVLIGFIMVMAPVIPHYGVTIAVAESFFVTKEHRKKGGAGLKLLRYAEDHARQVGSPGLLISAPLGGSLAEILPNIGYNETNRVFFKGFAHE